MAEGFLKHCYQVTIGTRTAAKLEGKTRAAIGSFKDAGLRQEDVRAKIGAYQSYMSKIESSSRLIRPT